MNLLAGFPADWRTPLVISRGGGRNSDGDPQPPTEHTIDGCLVGAKVSDDPTDRSEVPEGMATAYAPVNADVLSTDRITVPPGHYMSGVYEVDGMPAFWPLGTEITMRRL